MSTNSSYQKGIDLESAVMAIETAILKSSPSYKEDRFQIESRKIITVSGVRHEVDIYVEIDVAVGYKPVFIFECKNRETKVNKNDIIVFSEKIGAFNSQKGFFVARSFTRDAEAQAKKDPRIELLVATKHENAPSPIPLTLADREKVQCSVYFQNPSLPRNLDGQQVKIILRGEVVDFDGFAKEWGEEIYDEYLPSILRDSNKEGLHHFEKIGKREYKPGELTVDTHECLSCTAVLNVSVRVVRPKVITDFDVSTRGRIVSFGPVDSCVGKLQFEFLLHPNNETE